MGQVIGINTVIANKKEMDAYWTKRVESVVKIAKEYGYSSFDAEFWASQPAGVISLIEDIYKPKEKEKWDIYNITHIKDI